MIRFTFQLFNCVKTRKLQLILTFRTRRTYAMRFQTQVYLECCYKFKQLQGLLFFLIFSASNTAWATFLVGGPRSLVQFSRNATVKNHKKFMARKMADRKCQLCTPEEISNYLDDLESDFDTSSSSDDTNFESKYFLSFLEPFHGS